MKFEIKNRWTGAVLFSIETESWKLAVEAAIKSLADLSRADLFHANLSRANLFRANLSGADLSLVDLSCADLSGADLSLANLSRANLSGTNLYGADLYGANLSGTNLYGANLSGTNLYGADLYGANLFLADLSGANGVNKYLCTPLLMLKDQIGPIVAYKLVDANYQSPIQSSGKLTYTVGKEIAVANANTNENEHCADGVNVATLNWCMKEWREGYKILTVEFLAQDIAAIPTATDGKFRLHRCRVTGEKDLIEIGLVRKEDKDAEKG